MIYFRKITDFRLFAGPSWLVFPLLAGIFPYFRPYFKGKRARVREKTDSTGVVESVVVESLNIVGERNALEFLLPPGKGDILPE